MEYKQFCKNGHDIYVIGRYKDGHCKRCRKAVRHAQYEKHKDREKAASIKYAKEHKKRISQAAHEWIINHPEKRRKYNLKNGKGIEVERYNELFIKQKGKCAICKISQTDTKKNYFCVDHDHTCCPKVKSCGKCIRGLLCDLCNRGLGQFKDNLDIMKQAYDYLLNYNKIKVFNG